MNLVFIDEFKNSRKDHEFYGLVAVSINNSSYGKFKKGFYSKLKKLGWDKSVEIKGRYSFSSKKGDKTITVKKRLNFVEDLFELSKSGSGKYASAKIYYSMGIFKKKTSEKEMYNVLLTKIINKMPKGNKKGNKNGKNNLVIFLDNNQSIDIHKLSDNISSVCLKRGYILIERCFDVNSSNNTPGIIFADHVAYFISNYFKTNDFNEKSKERISELLEKFSDKKLSSKEREEFLRYVSSLRKEEKSKQLLLSLKNMTYAK